MSYGIGKLGLAPRAPIFPLYVSPRPKRACGSKFLEGFSRLALCIVCSAWGSSASELLKNRLLLPSNICVFSSHTSARTHAPSSSIGTYVSNAPREDFTIPDPTLQLQLGIKPIVATSRSDFTASACGGTCPCAARQRPRSHTPPRRLPRTSASQSTTSRSTWLGDTSSTRA